MPDETAPKRGRGRPRKAAPPAVAEPRVIVGADPGPKPESEPPVQMLVAGLDPKALAAAVLAEHGHYGVSEYGDRAIPDWLWSLTGPEYRGLSETDRASVDAAVAAVLYGETDMPPAVQVARYVTPTGPVTVVGQHPHFVTEPQVRELEDLPPLPTEAPASSAPLLVIVPSRGRPDAVARLFQAWVDTDAVGTADLRIDLDADDPVLSDYRALAEELPAWASFAVGPVRKPPVRKINRAARQSTSYFALGFMEEGCRPVSVGWAQAYVDELRRLGTGAVYGDDRFQGSGPCAEWALTSDIVTALGGRMVPAKLDGLTYAGAAVLELLRALGRVTYLPGVQIDVDLVEQAREHAQRDRLSWQFWKRTGLARDVASVRAVALPQRAE